MVTMHETTRLGELLDSLTTRIVELDTNAPKWSDEACGKLLESIITGAPIGMITIAVGPHGRWIGRRSPTTAGPARGEHGNTRRKTAATRCRPRQPGSPGTVPVSRRSPGKRVGVDVRNRQRKMVAGRSAALHGTVPQSAENCEARNGPRRSRTASRPRPRGRHEIPRVRRTDHPAGRLRRDSYRASPRDAQPAPASSLDHMSETRPRAASSTTPGAPTGTL